MPLPLVECSRCEGHGYNLTERWGPASRSEDISRNKTCDSCNGFGVRSRSSHSAYKTQANADRYRNTRAAETCFLCEGEGQLGPYECEQDCYTCRRLGKEPAFDPNTDLIVPEEFTHTAAPVSKDFWEAWLDFVEVRVLRQDREATWGEAHLGMHGALWTSIDYGATWKQPDETIKAEMMERLRGDSHVQLTKLMDHETRKVGGLLVIVVTQGSYAPVVADRKIFERNLPPTYTNDVLNRSWT